MENENITAVAEGKSSGYKVTKKDLRNANWPSRAPQSPTPSRRS